MNEVTTNTSRPRRKTVREKTGSDPAAIATSNPPPASEPPSTPANVNPSSVVLALQRHVLDPSHGPMYMTRRHQLQSAMRDLESLARKLTKSDEASQAALSASYELLLVITERFTLLLHGVVQLSAMNRASSLASIREARSRYRKVCDENQAASSQIDAPAILHLLAELSRESI